MIRVITILSILVSSVVYAHDADKNFTNDWFEKAALSWDNYKKEFNGLPNKRCLEIGSYEGQSTIYIAENYCNGENSQVDAVDTWEGSVEHTDIEKDGLFTRFKHNLKNHIDSGRVNVHRKMSSDALLQFVLEVRSGKRPKYDFIYIDASHIAKDVLMDAVLAWEILKIDGLMFFDDYKWDGYNEPWLNPEIAINGFLNCYETLYEVLEKSYQVHIRKIAENPKISNFHKKTVEKRKKMKLKDKIIHYYNKIMGN